MSKRKKNILLCVIALIAGALLYILFRPNTYIAAILNGIKYIDTIRQAYSLYANEFCKFYLPDLLWAFSLGCCLIAIYTPGRKGTIVCACFSFLCGLTWETLQRFNLLNGTGDLQDIIMYFLGSAMCIIFNIKETRKDEKS